MQKVLNRDNFGFGGLQWLYWSGYATVMPFLVIYLKSKGYKEVQTGAIMAAIMLVSIFAQPFWGHLCDRRLSIRNVMIVCMLISGIVTLFIPLVYQSFVLVILIAFIISFTENSMFTLIDSWTVQSSVKKPWIDYGPTRAMGSLGFAVTALFFGVLLDYFNYDLMFYAHLLVILVFVGCCFYVGKINPLSPGAAADKESFKKEAFRFNLKESWPFIWYLVSASLVFTGLRGMLTFYPILLDQAGGNNTDLGLSIFILAASEAPLFLMSRKLLQRFKDTALILVGMFFSVVQIFLNIAMTSVPGLIAVQASEALSFGLFLPASIYYVTRISPPGKSSTYLMIAVSCYCGIGSIFGNFGGGMIIERFGIYTMLWVGMALTAIGMLVFLFSTCIPANRSNISRI